MSKRPPAYARKRDANHNEIVSAARLLEYAGMVVVETDKLGHGAPDCICKWRDNSLLLVEIKTPDKRDNLTPDEVKWRDAFRDDYCVVTSVDELFDALDVPRELRPIIY